MEIYFFFLWNDVPAIADAPDHCIAISTVAGTIQLIHFRRPMGFMDVVGVLGAIAAMYSLSFVAPYLTTRSDMINCNLEGYAVWRERFFFDSGVIVVTLGEGLALVSILITTVSFAFNRRKTELNLIDRK